MDETTTSASVGRENRFLIRKCKCVVLMTRGSVRIRKIVGSTALVATHIRAIRHTILLQLTNSLGKNNIKKKKTKKDSIMCGVKTYEQTKEWSPHSFTFNLGQPRRHSSKVNLSWPAGNDNRTYCFSQIVQCWMVVIINETRN